MSYLVQRSHKVFALVVAVVITVGLHGAMLAGFDQVASESAPVVIASCD